ncbi:unnamed protein product [Brassicogethes aeneus]|uniref:C2H2-type domain-containing protein n=1 Tax=Brassicogethes aeneus TaxID=1431903 RepID=A0A9P0B5C2_BRAAE|nr:unnamed protein product [Brassicogethes aeneus]
MCSVVENKIDYSGVEELSNSEENNNNNYDENNTFAEEFQDEFGEQTTHLCCEICNIKVTSAKILQRHLYGRKHKMRSERKGKSYYCDLCDLTANSETQLNIHMSSKCIRKGV